MMDSLPRLSNVREIDIASSISAMTKDAIDTNANRNQR